MLLTARQGDVLTVTLARPEVRNAFNDELIAKLTETFRSVEKDVRAVVVRGEGKAFCAGGDLEWMRKAADYTEEQNANDAEKLAALFDAVSQCHAPVIARVHGAAFGGGLGLIAAADIAVAETACKFSFSEVRLGLIPATIARHVMPKIGVGNARWLFTTGTVFDAETAQRIGLVHGLAEHEMNLNDLVNSILTDLHRNGPEAVAAAKRLAFDSPLSDREAAERLAKHRAGKEGKEGVAAFLEKRAARFVTEWPQ
ncbi:MAG: enoyl-CoA hydratase/isomerase family protein [Fimbriimonadaceae bacterium]|nr:enoyl-CoA hydratase/isomerase family protein [Fimbriimonadaceae bacterium]